MLASDRPASGTSPDRQNEFISGWQKHECDHESRIVRRVTRYHSELRSRNPIVYYEINTYPFLSLVDSFIGCIFQPAPSNALTKEGAAIVASFAALAMAVCPVVSSNWL